MAQRPRAAIARAKRLIRDGLELPLADGLALERQAVMEHMADEEVVEAIAEFATRIRSADST